MDYVPGGEPVPQSPSDDPGQSAASFTDVDFLMIGVDQPRYGRFGKVVDFVIPPDVENAGRMVDGIRRMVAGAGHRLAPPEDQFLSELVDVAPWTGREEVGIRMGRPPSSLVDLFPVHSCPDPSA